VEDSFNHRQFRHQLMSPKLIWKIFHKKKIDFSFMVKLYKTKGILPIPTTTDEDGYGYGYEKAIGMYSVQ
jgi:hypothetical protein